MSGTKPRPFGGLENPGGYAFGCAVIPIISSLHCADNNVVEGCHSFTASTTVDLVTLRYSISADLCHALHRTRADTRTLRLRRLPSTAEVEQAPPRRVLMTTQMRFPFILVSFVLLTLPFPVSPSVSFPLRSILRLPFFLPCNNCLVTAPTPTPASSTSPRCSVTHDMRRNYQRCGLPRTATARAKRRATTHRPHTAPNLRDCDIVFLTSYHNQTPPRTHAALGFLAAHIGSLSFFAPPPTTTVCSAIPLPAAPTLHRPWHSFNWLRARPEYHRYAQPMTLPLSIDGAVVVTCPFAATILITI
ncbi:hypothetical protein DFH08DRAFT_951137 [Mycena albidolilacea]|uniref:Uncharacterized protein n=1 Tax=Mycena albidolilacea TaxID=1033008 RepID=A0AAD7AMD3_9AGAR|nr:hypothetical protein DFH08DRAFT_951137 [Mycena albidolilacea]